jgi:hypothetical protein
MRIRGSYSNIHSLRAVYSWTPPIENRLDDRLRGGSGVIMKGKDAC